MTLNLPADSQDPWGDQLNTALTDLDTRVVNLDTRVVNLEAVGGPSGSVDADLSGAWYVGRKWYALGTSITIGGFYTSAIANLSGMALSNIGVSGASLCTVSNGNIWTALTTQVGTDAEVVTMETINDFRLNVPLGTIADPEDQSVSYYGALRAAADWLLTNRPAARVFWLTAYGDAMNAGYPNGKTQNTHGNWYWEFNDAMREVANVYGIPVLNVGEESGINYYTCQFYTSDMIHPNTLGGQRYGEYVWSRIRHLSWLTSRPTAPAGGVVVPVTAVSIDQGTALALAPGATSQLTLTYTPGNATNKTATWQSSDTGVVTVSGDGNVTAVANGSATITVTSQDGGFTDTITITVSVAAVTGVSVQPPSWTGQPTDTITLTANVIPSNAGNKGVTWSSSAPGVATVDASGLVTAVANGTATITVTTADGGFTDTCAVTVSATVPVTSVDLQPPSVTLGAGATSQLTTTVSPANATDKTVTYASDTPAVATVNASGLVTGVAAGSAVITVTTADGGFTDTTDVTCATEWSFAPQATFAEANLNGITATGSDPTYTTVVAGTYGAILINTPGDNAIEFTVEDGSKGGWVVLGTDGADDFVGMGDFGQGQITACGKIIAGGITMVTPGDLGSPTTGWATGKVYRIGRSGDQFKIVRNDSGVDTVILQGSVSHMWAGADVQYATVGLGVLCAGGPGSQYSLPINCKTGIWNP